jgi:hypothetical protein
MRHPEIGHLREQVFGPGVLNKLESIFFEALPGVDHQEISGLKQASDVIDADGHEALGTIEISERDTATTNYDFLSGVHTLK